MVFTDAPKTFLLGVILGSINLLTENPKPTKPNLIALEIYISNHHGLICASHYSVYPSISTQRYIIPFGSQIHVDLERTLRNMIVVLS